MGRSHRSTERAAFRPEPRRGSSRSEHRHDEWRARREPGPPPRAGAGGKTSERHSLDNGIQMSGATVLIVDDEPLVREILSRYLTRDGFVVDTVADGVMALRRWRDGLDDLVLCGHMHAK